jgi:Tol biopolymer transport system component
VYYTNWVSGRIYRVPLDGSGTSEALFSIPQGYLPLGGLSVSVDGRTLATAVTTGQFEQTPQARIALLDLTSPGQPRLLDAQRYSGGLQFAPDGKSLAYVVRQNGTDNVWLQPVDGSAGYGVTDFQAEQIWSFRLSPDGRSLAVLRGHNDSDVVLLQESKP